MKRIYIEMDKVKKIVENHVWSEHKDLRPQFTLDGEEADIRVYVDEEGAHIMIPNCKCPEG